MSEADYLAYQRYLQSQHGGGAVDRTVEASLSDEQGWDTPRRAGLHRQPDGPQQRHHPRAGHPAQPGPVHRARPVRPAAPADLGAASRRCWCRIRRSSTDQSRKLVMTVAADGTVVPKPVEIGPLNGGLRDHQQRPDADRSGHHQRPDARPPGQQGHAAAGHHRSRRREARAVTERVSLDEPNAEPRLLSTASNARSATPCACRISSSTGRSSRRCSPRSSPSSAPSPISSCRSRSIRRSRRPPSRSPPAIPAPRPR